MLETIIGDKPNPTAADSLIDQISRVALTGTLYIGYPILASLDQPVYIDGLLICEEHGVVVFDFPDLSDLPATLLKLSERQDEIYLAVEQQLKRYRRLVVSRELVVDIHTLSYVSFEHPELSKRCEIATPQTLRGRLSHFTPITTEQRALVNSAIERVTSIRSSSKRPLPRRPDSLGAKLGEIDKAIANLDQWQKSAAIETPDGPQRIRGLAGSGKTIVLALKAAYLHSRHPDWSIAITFQTRSLYQQFKNLVRRFCFEHLNDEPNWENLQIVHSWGSSRRPGFYSIIAEHAGEPIRDFLYGKDLYGTERAFQGVCDELLSALADKTLEPVFDAVLIDEAQDFPSSFFRLAFMATRSPKRIVWAYDELQNLGQYSMAPPSELFGTDEHSRPNVPDFIDHPGQPRQDITLPVCYRNTPWALTCAHAIGFGIYRSRGLVQFFSNPDLWRAVGYDVLSGELRPDSFVSLKRRRDATPGYFSEQLTSEEAVQWETFDSPESQARKTAELIQKNLQEDELQPSDILVIFSDPRRTQIDASPLMAALRERGIGAHIAGVTSSVDELFVENSVAISGIYRAKGNEAPMVYVLNSDYCYHGLGLIRRRNILFTAITRSRAWVRIFGCGNSMAGLVEELEKVRANDFRLDFEIPSRNELERLRRIHRDRSQTEEEKVRKAEGGLAELLAMIESGDIEKDNLSKGLLDKLANLVGDAGS